jgi:hypothetical protein
MLVEEMTQRHEQFLRMLDTTGVERPVNVVNDHSPDRFPAMGLLQQVVCQGGGRDFRNVLVLADGGDFVFVQSAKGDAILQRDHGILQRPPSIGQSYSNLRTNGSAVLMRLR